MQTPLYEKHVQLGARLAPFAGWDMPIQYEGIIAEHLHTRTRASLFDTCHMGVLDLQGPRAEADIERLVTHRISTLRDGQCRYGFLLNDLGGVIDDLTVYRRGPEHFFIVVNAGTHEKDAEWIRTHLSPDTAFNDLSPQTAKLDVQGPLSREYAEKALALQLPELKYFRFADMDMNGLPCTVSRTGYTGEWGYELYFPAEGAAEVWDRLLAPGEIRPAGLGARDILRLEVGYPLYGHELGDDQTPVSASRGMFMDTEKDFIGKAAVMKDLENGVSRYLVGLKLQTKRAARVDDIVYQGDRTVGVVTSGALAPSLGVAVALAYVDVPVSEPGQPLEIEVRGKRLPAEIVQVPFYRDGTARKKSVS